MAWRTAWCSVPDHDDLGARVLALELLDALPRPLERRTDTRPALDVRAGRVDHVAVLVSWIVSLIWIGAIRRSSCSPSARATARPRPVSDPACGSRLCL